MSPVDLPQQFYSLVDAAVAGVSELTAHVWCCWRLGLGSLPVHRCAAAAALPRASVLPGPGPALCLAPHVAHKDSRVGSCQSRRPLGRPSRRKTHRPECHMWHGVFESWLVPTPGT